MCSPVGAPYVSAAPVPYESCLAHLSNWNSGIRHEIDADRADHSLDSSGRTRDVLGLPPKALLELVDEVVPAGGVAGGCPEVVVQLRQACVDGDWCEGSHDGEGRFVGG